jgi:hypothetical protein
MAPNLRGTEAENFKKVPYSKEIGSKIIRKILPG